MVKPLSGALYIFAMMCIIHCGLRVLPPSSKRTEPGTRHSQVKLGSYWNRPTHLHSGRSCRESTSLPQGGGATVFGNCQCFHCTSGNTFVVQLIVSFDNKLIHLKDSNYTMTIGAYIIHCLDLYYMGTIYPCFIGNSVLHFKLLN